MAKDKQSQYEKYAGKAPDETMQYRDVYEDQQVDRSKIDPVGSKTWRVVVSVVGAFLVAILTYCVVSVVMYGVGAINKYVDDVSIPGMTADLDSYGSGTYDDVGYVEDGSPQAISDGFGSVTGTEGTGGGTTVRSDFDSDAWLEWTMWCTMNGYDDIGDGYRDSSGKTYTVEEVAELYQQATGKSAVFTSVTLVETPAAEGEEVIDETGSVPSEGNSGPVEGIVEPNDETDVEGEGMIEVEPEDTDPEVGVETNSWTSCFWPNWINSLSALCVGMICWAMFYQVLMRNWEAQNLVNNTTDINQFQNDQHIAFPDEIQQKFDWFPDIGAHSGVQVSSLISHMMLSNKGLDNIQMAERYVEDVMDENGDVEFHKGELKETEDGDYIYSSVPMIDDRLGKAFFDSAKIPEKLRVFYEAKKIPYNPKNENREKLKGYDTVADLINREWEFPEYEPQRPAGAYMVDTAPVNTMVLAITRAGKGRVWPFYMPFPISSGSV